MKSLEDFHRDSRAATGRTSYCKECQKKKTRQWYAENAEAYNARVSKKMKSNPDIWRNSNYKRKYGITLAQYNEMLEAQGWVCAVCKEPEGRAATVNLAVDHCHSTNVVRGLLCSNCNRALGLLGDDIRRIEALAEYLR